MTEKWGSCNHFGTENVAMKTPGLHKNAHDGCRCW